MTTRSTWQRLRVSLSVLAAVIGTGAGLVYASHWVGERARTEVQRQSQAFSRAQAELARVRIEDADFRQSAGRYEALIARGIAKPEDRLVLVEWLNGLKRRHRLTELTYDLSAQRPLRLVMVPQAVPQALPGVRPSPALPNPAPLLPANNTQPGQAASSFTAITPLATRITLRALALHEGDAIEFLDALVREMPGFLQITDCTMVRAEVTATNAATPTLPRPESAPNIVLDCGLEWVSVRERGANG
jgi:hypothetical protein